MARPVLSVDGYTPEEIKKMFKNDERYTIGIRLYAVYQVSLGKPSRELEVLYNTSFKQITNWVHRFKSKGIEGLKDKASRGIKPRLSTAQKQQLKALVTQANPIDYGYHTAIWTGPILIDWIKKNFEVEYKKVQIYNILKELGLSHQKGKGFHIEANQELGSD
jgi:transposase